MKERYENYMDNFYKPNYLKYLKDVTKEDLKYHEQLNQGLIDYQK